MKSNADKYGIDPRYLKQMMCMFTYLEGAVPKDGPSAGITIATAILSALTHKIVRKEIGMTGEITLRGYVLPIGGLKEKSIAAHRSGLKTILIPKENERDIADIPEEVKSALEIIAVENVADVFSKVLK